MPRQQSGQNAGYDQDQGISRSNPTMQATPSLSGQNPPGIKTHSGLKPSEVPSLETAYAYKKGLAVYDRNDVDDNWEPIGNKYWICCRRTFQPNPQSDLRVKQYRLKDTQPEESDDTCDANHPGNWVNEGDIRVF